MIALIVPPCNNHHWRANKQNYCWYLFDKEPETSEVSRHSAVPWCMLWQHSGGQNGHQVARVRHCDAEIQLHHQLLTDGTSQGMQTSAFEPPASV